MTTTVSACPFCHKEVGNEQCAMCADTPTHSPTETESNPQEYWNKLWNKLGGIDGLRELLTPILEDKK